MGMDYEATLQFLRHQQRIEAVKPSMTRQDQERDFQRHKHFMRIRSRYPNPEPKSHGRGREPSRKDFEKRLEQMLLQDWDGKEQDFAWKHKTKTAGNSPKDTTAAKATDGKTDTEVPEVPTTRMEQIEQPALETEEVQMPDAVITAETMERSTLKVDVCATDESPSSPMMEQKPSVPNSYAGFGNPSAGGLARGMRPPDFRSILQNDVQTAPVVSEPVSVGKNQNNNGGLVLKPLDSLAGGGSGVNGFGADAGSGQNLQPPDLRSNLQTDSGNPSAGVSNFSGQNGFAEGRPLKAPDAQAEIPESTGGLGEPAARRLSGERRARPPDFRSILQNDVETAPVVNEPVSFGNNQDNNGGLVLKPLDSLAGGGSGLNGFGADAGFGQNLKPPDFRSNLQTDGGNPSVGIASFSGQSGLANGSLPVDSLADGGSGLNGFGANAGFGQNLKPPDFRSNLQTDSGNPSAGISSFPGQSDFANGGLVLKPLDSLAGGASGLNGVGADAGFGQNLKPPDFRSNPQTDSGDPSVGISSSSAQGDSAVKPFEGQAEVPRSLGDFRSDFGEAGAAKASAAPASDFFKEESGYVPSAAGAANGRRRRPRAGQL
eukprot:symbB.v1.2.019637.t1/scaffold1617.1/size109270/1